MISIQSRDEDVVIAQCTPEGTGALALIRLTGNDVRSVVKKIARLAAKKCITRVKSHTVHFGWIRNCINPESRSESEGESIIDEVMFIVLDAPHTFTGQHTIEITCHNNPFIIDQIIKGAIEHGARLAQPGEFSRRGFLSGKRDLLQTEAINELIHSSSLFAIRQSLSQLQGSLSHKIQLISESAINALAWCEAQFEFLDEEINSRTEIQTYVRKILSEIELLTKAYESQKQIRQGIRIALLGSVNAGKSSLFNALLNENRSIVTHIPGTTRDLVEAFIYRDGRHWTLVDTAGLRTANDIVEAEGIKRAYQEAQKADIILLIYDGSRPLSKSEEHIYAEIINSHSTKLITVTNKADLDLNNKKADNIAVSAKTKKNIDVLYQHLDTTVNSLFDTIGSTYLINKRHINILITAKQQVRSCLDQLECSRPHYELISCQIRDFLELLSELSGKSVSEAGLDAVFKQFCVGK